MKQFFKTIAFLILSCVFCFSCQTKSLWPEVNNSQKPWTYWWWMGNAVDKENISWNLRQYKGAGLGGVHIIPIYGVKGEEDKFIDFMSDEWQDMVAFTADEAKRLGLGVDLTLGTGWCYGGADVDENSGLMRSIIDEYKIEKNIQHFNCSSNSDYSFDKIETVLAITPDGTRLDITDKLSGNNQLITDIPSGTYLFVMRMQGPTYKVKRAAPGGEGYMIDPFSLEAFDLYSAKFDSVFRNKLKGKIRAIYHDSYEYYKADWTSNFYEKFEQRKGYDLRYFLPELSGQIINDTTIRVLADYREVAADLHISYITRIKEWADKNNVSFRNQAHGSPTNWLDTYSAAEIPETESFGSSVFNIPGLDRDPRYIRKDKPDKLLMKFASSAAHLNGANLVSSETHTWLREHFQVALSHCKPELDKLFLAGINHIFYHGIAYSPKDAEWPGWLFYAESNFAPTNSIFQHFPAMNEYVTKCQSVLQAGKPDNDILLYFPIQDIWHTSLYKGKKLFQLTVHDDIIQSTPFYNLAFFLDSTGYSTDYISDKQLLFANNSSNNKISIKENQYKTLIVPPCKYLPVETLLKIEELVKSGCYVLFFDEVPSIPAGFSNLQKNMEIIANIKSSLTTDTYNNLDVISSYEIKKLHDKLVSHDVLNEKFHTYGLSFIRRKIDSGYYYFVSNLYSGKSINDYIPLAVNDMDVILLDPINCLTGKAILKKEIGTTSVLLQLDPGESIILKATKNKVQNVADWQYMQSEGKPIQLKGSWNITFTEGGPELPTPVETDELKSWTELGDTVQTRKFGGTAIYSIQFKMTENESDDYIITFDNVYESVTIVINGYRMPALFAYPFKQRIGKYIKVGVNNLELEVVNLSANRIKSLDQQNSNWKHFYNINYPDITNKPFDASAWKIRDSGITGNIVLTPIIYTN